MQPISEIRAWRVNGFVMVLIFVVIIVVEFLLFRSMILSGELELLWFLIPIFILLMLIPSGFFIIHPNEAKVLVLFGKYMGSVRDAGFWWSNPFVVRKHVSLKIRNFNSERLKVNDLNGNPIEIAAVVVWRVTDSARASFDVENYEQFVAIQSEMAIRALASEYPYDAHDDERASLRGSPRKLPIT